MVLVRWNANGKQIQVEGRKAAIRDGTSNLSFRATDNGLRFRTGNTTATTPGKIGLSVNVPDDASLVISPIDPIDAPPLGKMQFGDLVVFFDRLVVAQGGRRTEFDVPEESHVRIRVDDSETEVECAKLTLDLNTLRVMAERAVNLPESVGEPNVETATISRTFAYPISEDSQPASFPWEKTRTLPTS